MSWIPEGGYSGSQPASEMRPPARVEKIHVIPRDDLVEHHTTSDCVCGPTCEPVKRLNDGAVGWMYTHHSLDGREASE